VQNSQSSNPTIAKLLEVDADLAAQEVEVAAQLVSIQEKRHSLKTVIDMFAPADRSDTVPVGIPAPIPFTEERSQPITPDVALLELNSANANITVEAPTTPQPQKQQSKKNASPTSSKQGKKSTSNKEPIKNTSTWQQYMKDDFGNATLSEAVSEVMQQQKEQVLEISIIIDTIFVNDIPKEVRSTARERVSNVLSVGAKSGKWYRGQLGKYSMSKAAVEI